MRYKVKMMGQDGSGNVLAPNLTLKLNPLLQTFPKAQRKEEQSQVTFLILRNISNLRQLYHFYCTLGHNRVQSTRSEMTRFQFWRFVKDSRIHHYGLSLPEMDRIVAPCLDKESVHQPTERFSLSDFLSSITILSFAIFKDKVRLPHAQADGDSKSCSVPQRPRRTPVNRSQPSILSLCLQMLINENIMKYSGVVRGGFLFDPRKGINALKYMEGSWKVYKTLCDGQQKQEPTLKMRKLLFALKEYDIIGSRFSTENFLNILCSDHPSAFEGGVYNLEIEICFLEYFEALVATAADFVNEDSIAQHTEALSTSYPHHQATASNSTLGHSRPSTGYSRRSSLSAKSIQSITHIDENDEDGSVVTDFHTLALERGTNRTEQKAAGTVTASSKPADAGAISGELVENAEASTSEISRLNSKSSTPEVAPEVMEERERQFLHWSMKLDIFFTRHLFPAWQKSEMLRREAARYRRRKLDL